MIYARLIEGELRQSCEYRTHKLVLEVWGRSKVELVVEIEVLRNHKLVLEVWGRSKGG